MVVVRVLIIRIAGVGAVDAHDMSITILHPNASEEATRSGFVLRLYVKDRGPHITDELPAYEGHVIMLQIETDRVDKHHVLEAGRRIAQLKCMT